MTPVKTMVASLALIIAPAIMPMSVLNAQDDVAQSAAEQSAIQMRSEQVIALINGTLDAPFEDIFTAAFLSQVPPSQLAGFSAQLTSQYGQAVEVESLNPASGNRAALIVRMERALGNGAISIDPNDGNKITELRFTSFDPIGDNAQKITADLSALPGTVSAYFGPLDGSSPVISINPDEELGIGSAFKLYVLSALSERIAKTDDTWGTATTLDKTPRSFPSGMMQDWPENAPVTLQTLATMMISISDNTATDALVEYVGTEAIIREVIKSGHSEPALNVPFMTTRQMFAIKSSGAQRIAEFRAADAERKAEILSAFDDTELDVNTVQVAFSGGPTALDIEWLASANDMRKLLGQLSQDDDPTALNIMAVNPSLTGTGRKNWPRAYYKGGSEPGVLNLTWLLYNQAGQPYALTLGWNNPDANLDNTALELIAQRILALSL